MISDNDARLTELEIRMAYLERHISEQDRVMFAMGERIDLLERRCTQLQNKLSQSNEPAFADASFSEKPPHY